MEMPTFLPKGATQLQTKDANCSRLVTKIRWVVESANSRLKTWRLLDKTLPNTHIPSIGDYAQIICALCNKFRPPLSSGTFEKDIEIAAKMKVLARSSNELQTLIIDQGLDRRSYKWTPLDASAACPLFPQLSEDEIRELTLGVYQVKLARSYTQEHCSHDGSYDILVNSDVPMILSAKIQSRHISAKSYKLWIKYSCSIVEGWYCTCKNGSRVVGMCAHITSVIWYLSYMRHEASPFKGIPNWSDTIEDASRIPTIDESDSDDPEE